MASSIGYNSVLSAKASKEIVTSWNWYEERQTGLGDKFLHEVLLRLKQVGLTPERYPVSFRAYRQHILMAFPFQLFIPLTKKGNW